MLCKNPYTIGTAAYGCGQCMHCRIKARRVWSHRLMLEASQHEHSSFWTLTYSDQHLPDGGSLAPRQTQEFLKRLRKYVEPARLRFFCVGEYGDDTDRPHYHLAIFGYPKCVYSRSRYSRWTQNCCPHCDLIRDKWGRGNVFGGALEIKSAEYIAGYVTKKMTSADDIRLNGRHPEFARMSRKPGIGCYAMDDVADALLKIDFEKNGDLDVPVALAHGNRQLPLGKYLRSKLRERIGREPQALPDTRQKEEMLALQQRAIKNQTGIKLQILEENAQKRLNKETKLNIFKSQRTL